MSQSVINQNAFSDYKFPYPFEQIEYLAILLLDEVEQIIVICQCQRLKQIRSARNCQVTKFYND